MVVWSCLYILFGSSLLGPPASMSQLSYLLDNQDCRLALPCLENIIIMVIIYQSIPAASILPGKPLGKPQAFKKIGQMLGPAGNFCWQMPRSPLLRPFFNKHDCFSSIELHKTGHEMSHSDRTKTKQMVLYFCRSFMVDICSSYSKMTMFETLDTEFRRK